MTKMLSFVAALALGLLCVAPPEFFKEASKMALALGASDPAVKTDYFIPVFVNSFAWLYIVIAAGLVAFFMATLDELHVALKALLVYTFIVGCFFSQVPYFSFTAFVLLVLTVAIFLGFKRCDFGPVFKMAEAVFWLEVVIAVLRLCGRETLMNFGRPEPIFFGTIFQHMRFGSLLCILVPFLIVKDWRYVFPIAAAVVLTTSSGFAVSVLAGAAVWAFLAMRGRRGLMVWIFLGILAAGALYGATLGRDSFAVAWREGRLPIWGLCLKTWILDTRGPMVADAQGFMVQTGPIDWKCAFFGHGLDTFYNIFPAYKHDPAPFPQAHNDWIQLAWELGAMGFALFSAYCIDLVWRLYRSGKFLAVAGLAVIGTNMVFHFPSRMTQTALLMVAFAAYCERILDEPGFYRP